MTDTPQIATLDELRKRLLAYQGMDTQAVLEQRNIDFNWFLNTGGDKRILDNPLFLHIWSNAYYVSRQELNIQLLHLIQYIDQLTRDDGEPAREIDPEVSTITLILPDDDTIQNQLKVINGLIKNLGSRRHKSDGSNMPPADICQIILDYYDHVPGPDETRHQIRITLDPSLVKNVQGARDFLSALKTELEEALEPTGLEGQPRHEENPSAL